MRERVRNFFGFPMGGERALKVINPTHTYSLIGGISVESDHDRVRGVTLVIPSDMLYGGDLSTLLSISDSI